MTKYTTPGSGHAAGGKDRQLRAAAESGVHRYSAAPLPSPAHLGAGLQAASGRISEAKGKKIILSHGASVHGLPALRTFPGNQWLDIAMIRMNHTGIHMDAEQRTRDANDIGAT